MPTRTSRAAWQGDLRKGGGTMQLGSGAFEGAYTVASRFEEASGTNPEELLGAAHAGCFSMALASGLTRAGHAPTRIDTEAQVHLEKVGEGFKITRVALSTEGEVSGIDEKMFREQAEVAKENCPVSRLFAGAEITLEAKLVA